MHTSQVKGAYTDCHRYRWHRSSVPMRNTCLCHKRVQQAPRTVCNARSESEIAVEAESRAEARRKRRQANTQVQDTIVVDPADTVMTTEERRVQTTTPPPETPERRQARELLNRKSEVIIKLATAGTDIGEAIREYRHEIDDLLLATLEKRIEAASGVEEEKNAMQGLFLLWRRLKAERQRMEASPAARLLDDALQVMDPASGLTLKDRQQKPPSAVSSLTRNTGIWSPQAPHLAKQQLSALQETTVLLRRAFSAPGSRPINIFGVAAALAEGQEIPPEELVNEFVPREAFVAESKALLESVMGEQRDIERAWKAGEVKEHQDAVSNLVKERRLAIVQIQEIITLAQTLRL